MRSVPCPRLVVAACSLLLLPALACAAPQESKPTAPQKPGPAAGAKVSLQQAEDRIVVRLDGEPFTEYRFVDPRFPIFYPVLGPGGAPMTRRHPIEAAGAGEAEDHPHHRSLWFTHGAVNGIDFWAGKGRIEQVEVALDEAKARVRTRNQWVKDEEIVCTDTRTLTFGGDEDARWIDLCVTIHADHGALTFGDTKEGSMAIRVAPTLRLRGKVAKGAIRNSEGITGKDAWGKRARWVDYSGPVDGVPVGVTVMDHPDNPRHPTWWHARDYGLLAANPFGVHDFERKPAGTGDLVIEEGEGLRLRYRFWLHRGVGTPERIERAYSQFAGR